VEQFCKHIERLLAQYDYVVVPDLGGFVVQTESAVLLPDRITPPYSTIGFNPLMHHADGLLAIEIARSEQISYRLAMEYISKMVGNLKSELIATENIRFGNLGTFYHNEMGSLFFSPEVKVGFLPHNFGLSNLYISQRGLTKQKSTPKITISLPSTRIFKYASVAMLVLGLFVVLPRVNDMRQLHNADLATSVFYNSIQPPVVSKTKTGKVNASPILIAKDSEKYHVIVASLPTMSSADKVCDELHSGDFKSAHVLVPAKMYRVAIQSFSVREKAIQYMENLRKTSKRFETAWVYCNK
jgi:hypothetical protein